MIRAGIDWGSTSFRAYRFDEFGCVEDTITSDRGLKSLTTNSTTNSTTGTTDTASNARHFEACLLDTVGHWLSAGDQVILAGMVTSKNGWCETPYLPCPADLSTVLDHAIRLHRENVELIFLPGISQHEPTADVIRGEELQLLGTSTRHKQSLLVMPGTHSKWAKLHDGVVERFHTIMTGELFELLSRHSLAGALAAPGDDPQAFLDGVSLGYESDTLISELFGCRAGVLLGSLHSTAVNDRLSGLLIGHELREGLQHFEAHQQSLALIGDQQLCERYQRACQHLGLPAATLDGDASQLGFATLIKLIQRSLR